MTPAFTAFTGFHLSFHQNIRRNFQHLVAKVKSVKALPYKSYPEQKPETFEERCTSIGKYRFSISPLSPGTHKAANLRDFFKVKAQVKAVKGVKAP